jgi:hypothetical protein
LHRRRAVAAGDGEDDLPFRDDGIDVDFAGDEALEQVK